MKQKKSSATSQVPHWASCKSSLPVVSPVILAALAANHHPSLASLLNCSSISSFLNLCSIPKKISHFPLCLFTYFCSVLHADPFRNVHLNLFSSFLISVLSTPLSWHLLHLLHLKAFAIKVHFGASDRIRHDNDILRLRFSVSLLPPRAHFLLLQPFPSSPSFSEILPLQHRHTTNSAQTAERERAIFQTSPMLVSLWDVCYSSCLSFLPLLLSPLCRKESCDPFFALSTNLSFCTSPVFSLHFSSFFPLLFILLYLNSPPFDRVFGSRVLFLFASRVPRSPPWLFSSKVLGSLPWLFLFSLCSSQWALSSPVHSQVSCECILFHWT